MLVLAFALVLALCFCIYNCWFQKEKYNRMTVEEKKNKIIFNSPSAWLIYSISVFICLIGLLTYYIYLFFVEVLKLGK